MGGDERERWRRRTLTLDTVLALGGIALFLAYTVNGEHWDGLSLVHPWYLALKESGTGLAIAVVALAGAAGYAHFLMRRLSARSLRRSLAGGRGSSPDPQIAEWIAKAFERNVSPRRVALGVEPAGWGRFARNKVARVLADADKYVQQLNSRFTDPSGGAETAAQSGTANVPEVSAAPAVAAPTDYASPPPAGRQSGSR